MRFANPASILGTALGVPLAIVATVSIGGVLKPARESTSAERATTATQAPSAPSTSNTTATALEPGSPAATLATLSAQAGDVVRATETALADLQLDDTERQLIRIELVEVDNALVATVRRVDDFVAGNPAAASDSIDELETLQAATAELDHDIAALLATIDDASLTVDRVLLAAREMAAAADATERAARRWDGTSRL